MCVCVVSLNQVCVLMGYFCHCVFPDDESSSCSKEGSRRRCRLLVQTSRQHHRRRDRATAPSSGSGLKNLCDIRTHSDWLFQAHWLWPYATSVPKAAKHTHTHTNAHKQTLIDLKACRQIIWTHTYSHALKHFLKAERLIVHAKIFMMTPKASQPDGEPVMDVWPKEFGTTYTVFTTGLCLNKGYSRCEHGTGFSRLMFWSNLISHLIYQLLHKRQMVFLRQVLMSKTW